MKKIIRLTESDLKKIIMKTINEDLEMMDVSSDSDYYKLRKRKIEIPFDEVAMLYQFAHNYCYDKENYSYCREIENVANKYGLRW
jgi:hypothetical protein